jgi:hypothetical protein
MSDEADLDVNCAASSAFGSLVSLRPEFRFNGDSNNEKEVKAFIKIFIEESFLYSNNTNRDWMLNGLNILANGESKRAQILLQAHHIDIRPPDDARLLFRWAIDIAEEFISK